MSKESRQAVRAVFLAAIMVISVFAAGIAFSGSAAADVTSIDAISAEDTTAGDIDQIENVTLVGVDRTGSNLSDIDVTIEGAPNLSVVGATVSSAENFDLSNVSADTRSDGGFFVEVDGNNTPNGNITIEVTLDTTNVDPGTTATYDATSGDGASASGDFQVQSDNDGSQSDGVLTVDPDGGTDAYDTIQAAVNNAESGDTVEVTSGTYDEQVVIDRGDDDASDLTIRAVDGASPTISYSAEGGEPAVAIDQDDVTIEGLEIVRNNSGDLVAQAVRVAGNNVELTDNTYRLGVGANSAAVAVLTDPSGAAGDLDVSGVTISDVTISGGEVITKDASQSGVLVADDGAASFGGAGSVSVSDVTFTANADSTQVYELDTDGGVINIADTLDNNEFDRAAAASETASGASINGFSIEGIISTSIQDAVDRADSGSTVAVASGTYEESVEVRTGGLTLSGAGPDSTTIVGDGVNAGSKPHAAIHVDDGSGPVRNVTIEGFTVENPDGKFGIFAGTGSTNKDPDGIGGLVIRDNVVQDVSTNSTGGALTGGPAGIGIRGDYGTDGNPGIEISNNEISNVKTNGYTNAVGITLKSFTGDAGFGFASNASSVTDTSSPPATDTDILKNIISNIDGGDNSRTKGISVSGEFEDVRVESNNISGISAANDGSAGNAFGITFTENGGSYTGNQYDIDGDGNGERIGPRNFTITSNEIDQISAESPSALFIGGYEDLGDAHSVSNNNFLDGTVNRFAGKQPGYQIGDGDTLNAENNYWGAASGPDGAISPPSNTDNPDTLPDGDGIVAFTNGKDADGNPQTGLVDVTPWLDAPAPNGVATAPVTNNDTGELYPTIQAAVDDTSPGDTVVVDAGTYEESVTITTENITLRGTNRPTIVGDGANEGSQPHATIHVDGNPAATDTTIEGFTIRNPDGFYGIYAGTGGSNSDVDGLEVRDNLIENIATNTTSHSPLAGGAAGLYVRAEYDSIIIEQNIIRGVDTTGDQYQNAAGISLSSFIGDEAFAGDDSGSETAEQSRIRNNEITNITGAQSSRTKGISVSGEFDGVYIRNNSITDITALTDDSDVFAITLTENPPTDNSDFDNDGTDERIGPQDFLIKNNVIDQLNAGRTAAVFVGGYEELGFSEVKRNNIFDGTVERFYSADQDGADQGEGGLLRAQLNWWGTERGPNDGSDVNVGSQVAYDPFLTTPAQNIEVDDVGDTKKFAQDIIAPAGQDVTAVGFPGPVPEGYTVGDAFENVSGGAIYEYDRQAETFVLVTSSEEISALDAFVIAQNTTTSDESTQVVIEYAKTPDNPGSPSIETIEPGFNLISPRSLGDAYGAFDAPSDRETIYGTYGAPLPRSESAFLGPADQDTNFIETTFGPNQDDPVVTPYGGYLVFTQEERQITTFVQTGTTADEVINSLNQTAT